MLKMEIKIDERIGLYCEIFHELYDRISKLIPEHAVEIALGIFEEIAKDLRTEQIAQWRIKRKSDENAESDVRATAKQREALHKFGVKHIPEDLSKEEASEALDLLIGFSKEGDSESISRIVEELNRRWMEKKTRQPKK
jgi:hypothetical protein